MLSRIGNNLFWMGRYLEMATQITGYTKVHYLSYVDTPFPAYKTEMLNDVLEASQHKDEFYIYNKKAKIEEVLQFVALSDHNSCSIKKLVTQLRENARGSRDNIPPDLWEYINTFYHTINGFEGSTMQGESFQNFCQAVDMYQYTIKGYVGNALVKNDVWLLISLGIHLEGAIQTIRFLKHTMASLNSLQAEEYPAEYESFKLRLLLESLGCYEMYKSYFRQNVHRMDVLNFIAFNTLYPRSVAYHVNAIKQISMDPHFKEHKVIDSVQHHAETLAENMKNQTLETLNELEVEFLEDTLGSLQGLAGMLSHKYMVY